MQEGRGYRIAFGERMAKAATVRKGERIVEFTTSYKDRAGEIVALFTATFANSEGAEEGNLIGGLVREMLATLPEDDMTVFCALEDGALVGTIVFTRLSFPSDNRWVVLLSPVAVATSAQGRGVGQALIRHGLHRLRRDGVDVAVTYGDPSFYGRIGFQPVTELVVPAPLTLQFPVGWQAQSLTEQPLEPLPGPSRCVAPLDNPDLW